MEISNLKAFKEIPAAYQKPLEVISHCFEKGDTLIGDLIKTLPKVESSSLKRWLFNHPSLRCLEKKLLDGVQKLFEEHFDVQFFREGASQLPNNPPERNRYLGQAIGFFCDRAGEIDHIDPMVILKVQLLGLGVIKESDLTVEEGKVPRASSIGYGTF